MTHRNLLTSAFSLGVAVVTLGASACVTVEVPTITLFDDAGAPLDGAPDDASAPAPQWVPGTYPSPDALVEADACAALADCCEADEAGDLYCVDTVGCEAGFQRELNYGYCSAYTYTGYVVDIFVTQ